MIILLLNSFLDVSLALSLLSLTVSSLSCIATLFCLLNFCKQLLEYVLGCIHYLNHTSNQVPNFSSPPQSSSSDQMLIGVCLSFSSFCVMKTGSLRNFSLSSPLVNFPYFHFPTMSITAYFLFWFLLLMLLMSPICSLHCALSSLSFATLMILISSATCHPELMLTLSPSVKLPVLPDLAVTVSSRIVIQIFQGSQGSHDGRTEM